MSLGFHHRILEHLRTGILEIQTLPANHSGEPNVGGKGARDRRRPLQHSLECGFGVGGLGGVAADEVANLLLCGRRIVRQLLTCLAPRMAGGSVATFLDPSLPTLVAARRWT